MSFCSRLQCCPPTLRASNLPSTASRATSPPAQNYGWGITAITTMHSGEMKQMSRVVQFWTKSLIGIQNSPSSLSVICS